MAASIYYPEEDRQVLQGAISVKGRASPHASVYFFLDHLGKKIGEATVTANSAGEWSTPIGLLPGRYVACAVELPKPATRPEALPPPYRVSFPVVPESQSEG